MGRDVAHKISLSALLDATTTRAVGDWIETVQESERVRWVPVGGRDNNIGIINMGRDPAAGIVERITNAIDAVLERRWIEEGRPRDIGSPREAVRDWWGVPHGRLADVDRPQDLEKGLLERVRVTLQKSERRDLPTVDIRDTGIGIEASEFGSTILSLNENRKINKKFLAGAFGQGGSTALAFSHFTIIVSRPHMDLNAPVAATIVRFNQGDLLRDKHGRYEYLVSSESEMPLEIPLGQLDFEPGTLVRHVASELKKYSNRMTVLTNSLWWLSHNYLFDPVLPFTIVDARGDTPVRRSVLGNNRLLTNGPTTEYKQSARRSLQGGYVNIHWWVLSGEGSSPRERIKQYTLPSQPVIVTYNGQRQGALPNTVIKKELELPYLERFLVVHVDCDELDPESRRHLFSSTRESLKDTIIGDALRQLVVETLREDDSLRDLERERKRRFLNADDSDATRSVRDRLASRVSKFIRGSGRGKGDESTRSGGTDSVSDPIPVQEPPTFLRITGSEKKSIVSGRTFSVPFETDADPRYFENVDVFVATARDPNFASYTGRTNLNGGRGRVYFKPHDSLAIGAETTISVELRLAEGSLADSCGIVTVEPPEVAGTQSGKGLTPNVNPTWVGKDDAIWPTLGWDQNSVAQVNTDAESIDILVSSENANLSRLVARAQRHGRNVVDRVKNYYLEHVAFYAFLSDRLSADAPEVKESDLEGEDAARSLEASLMAASETVAGIIDGLMPMFIAETSES